jgi:hypothetical protein
VAVPDSSKTKDNAPKIKIGLLSFFFFEMIYVSHFSCWGKPDGTSNLFLLFTGP